MSIFQGQPLQLPELGLHVAPSKVVNWAKSTLEKIRALPALGQDVNILHLNVGAAMLKAWSVTYSDKPDAPDWAYPNDLDLVATTAAAKKSRLEWHQAWLEKLIKFFGASDVDALFRAIQRDVRYNTNIATTAAVAEWTLKIATVETTMPEGILAAADPKALYKAYLATLPPDLRAYVEKHKPNDQPATWETVVKLLRSKVEAAEAHSDFVRASDFKSAFSKPGKGGSGTSDADPRNSGQITDGRRWSGRGGRSHSRGRRNQGDGHDRRVAHEAEKEQDGGKGGKAGGKSRGGKSGGKTGKRQREGKGDAEPTAKKKAVTCFNCGELGHYKSKCTKPEQLRITNGAAGDP